jgi:hypothetical protein
LAKILNFTQDMDHSSSSKIPKSRFVMHNGRLNYEQWIYRINTLLQFVSTGNRLLGMRCHVYNTHCDAQTIKYTSRQQMFNAHVMPVTDLQEHATGCTWMHGSGRELGRAWSWVGQGAGQGRELSMAWSWIGRELDRAGSWVWQGAGEGRELGRAWSWIGQGAGQGRELDRQGAG